MIGLPHIWMPLEAFLWKAMTFLSSAFIWILKISHLARNVDTLLENLGKQLYFRYSQTEDIDFLDLAVEYSQLTTKITASDHPDYLTRLDFLAVLLETRFKSEGFRSDIVDSVQITRTAVIATNHNDDKIVYRWSNLGERLGRLFGSGGNIVYISDIVYGSGGNIADLDEGIWYLSQAAKVTEDPILLFNHLNEFAFCLGLRFEVLAEIEDLDKAISLRRQALQATDDQDESWLYCLECLITDMEDRYIDTGELSEAIMEAYNAIKATSPGVGAVIGANTGVFRLLQENTPDQ